MRWLIVLGITLLSQACVNQTQIAQDAVQSKFMLSNVNFRNIESFPGNLVCGEYTTSRRKNNYKRFIYILGDLNTQPSKEDSLIFCGENAAQALYQIYGINFNGEAGKKLLQVREDYLKLGAALDLYRAENSFLPKTEQGLIALREPSAIAPKPRAFRDGGYIDEVPLDPWKRPYIYIGSTYAGVHSPYKLLSLGADGQEGGIDENADIKSAYIKYINYVYTLN
ncbi:MAG: general secretion pathway protein G [Halioglobus sp.]|jgi:general secretion pathway protein G